MFTDEEAAEILRTYGAKVLELIALLEPNFTGYEERSRLAGAFEDMSRNDLEGVAMMALMTLARIRQQPSESLFGLGSLT